MASSSASCVEERVAIITHDLYPYGAQRVTASLVESLTADFSASCEVVSLGGGPLAVPIRRVAPVHNVGHTWKLPARELGPLLYAMRRRGYCRAILNSVISGVAAKPLRELGFHIVGLVHEMPELIASEALQSRLGQMLDSAHVVVFPHETVRDKIAHAFPDLRGNARIECFPQGLIRRNLWRDRTPEARNTVRQSLGIPAESPIVLGVGFGDLRKGVDLFLDCARIVNERLDLQCHFVWIGSINEALRSNLLQEGRLTDPPSPYLHLLGFQEDTAPYHSAADLFALTSREDPFPNVVLESMDAGVPVIAFSDSGGGACLAQTVAGRVVAPLDVDAYAGAIVGLLRDHDAREALAAKLQRVVDADFGFRRYTQRLLDLLHAAA